MARQRTTTVYVEVLATRVALWCDRCMLPSGIKAWIVLRFGDRMQLQERVWCRDCDSGRFVHDND